MQLKNLTITFLKQNHPGLIEFFHFCSYSKKFSRRLDIV